MGEGVRETLAFFSDLLPGLIIHSVPSGTKAFDWTIPDEWSIKSAYIEDESGNRIIDFKKNNLHVVGYSEPVNLWLDRSELEKHLYSLPDNPDAIPYVTSYYERRWGFCLCDKQRMSLPSGSYHVVIDSELRPGVLNYAELIIPGETNEEIFLSTYICHPSMANNELSGPVVTAGICKWLLSLENRRYTYRIVFVPETIGSIVYLSRNLQILKENVVAGFNITCVGDDRSYSYLPSRHGNTISDKVALHVLSHTDPSFKIYTWLDRGSDERQYCAPGVDLPIATIMRSKYASYPEYHTSLDNLDFVTPSGLNGGYTAIKQALEILEKDCTPRINVYCEPQLGKRGIYPTLSTKKTADSVRDTMNLISYLDGEHTILEIATLINKPFWELMPLLKNLSNHGLTC
jgi:aminopeptidase-like protein